MASRFATGAFIGLITFAVSYAALMGFAMVRFSYFEGPVPDVAYGIPIPLLIGAFAGLIAFMREADR